jgi:Ni,Fe-hydrogenase III small subunit
MLTRIFHPVGEALPAPDPAQVSTLAARLEEAGRRRRGRPTSLLHVGTGGCGGCALELGALDGPIWDMGRAGLAFVEVPARADMLLVTGSGARNAAGPLRRAWEAMSGPRYVIAVGDCAAGDGGGGYAMTPGGVGAIVPIDLVVRGSPPPPAAILLAVLTLAEAAVRS